MNRIAPQEYKIYKHQQLMDELNQLMIDIKLALYHDREKPSVSDLDKMHHRIREILSQDNTPLKKYR